MSVSLSWVCDKYRFLFGFTFSKLVFSQSCIFPIKILTQVQNVCLSKNKNQDIEIKEPTDWKEILTNQVSKGLVSRIYKKLLQIRNKKTGNSLKQWSEDPERFLQGRCLNKQWAHENTLGIAGPRERANQSRSEVPPPCPEIAKNQRQVVERFGEDSDWLKLRHCWWEWNCHFGNSLVVSQNVKTNRSCHRIQQFYL